MTYEEYEKEHIERHKEGEICMNCPPWYRKCCEKCWHKNIVYKTSQDYCIDENCKCHNSPPNPTKIMNTPTEKEIDDFHNKVECHKSKEHQKECERCKKVATK